MKDLEIGAKVPVVIPDPFGLDTIIEGIILKVIDGGRRLQVLFHDLGIIQRVQFVRNNMEQGKYIRLNHRFGYDPIIDLNAYHGLGGCGMKGV